MKIGDTVIINQKKGVVIDRMQAGMDRYKISVKFFPDNPNPYNTDIRDYFEDTVHIQLSKNTSFNKKKPKKKSKK